MANLFKRLWSLWFGLWFFLYYVILFPLYFLLLIKKTNITHHIAHHLNVGWAYFIFFFGLIRVKTTINFRGIFPKNGVYISNHRSYLDIPVTYLAIPVFFRYIGKAELTKVPLFGFMYKRLHIMVNRASIKDKNKSLNEAHNCIKKNEAVFIFPEGTTKHSAGTILGNFYDGAFLLAVENQVPIVPITIINSSKALSADGRFLMRPFVTIKVIVDEPISTDNLTKNDLEPLKAYCKDLIIRNIIKEHGT